MLVVAAPVLNALLQTTRRAIPGQPTQPILAHVLLTAENGELAALGTDGTTWVRASAAVDTPDAPVALAIKGSQFADIASKFAAGTITLTPNETGVVVTAGRSKYNLPTLPAADFPKWPDVKGEVIARCEAGALKLALNRALAHVAKDERMWASAALLYHRGHELAVVGTYAGAGAISTVAGGLAAHNPLALPNGPAKLVEGILPTSDSPVELTLSGGTLAFRTERILVVSPLKDDSLPGWDTHIAPSIRETDAQASHYLNTKELADAISRLLVTQPDPMQQTITVGFGPETALFTAEGQDGSGREEVPCEGTTTTEGRYHAGRLLRCVQSIKGDKVRVGSIPGGIRLSDTRDADSMQLLTRLTT